MQENIAMGQYPKKISPAVAWSVLIGYTAVLIASGVIIGETFFWKVKYNTKNKQAMVLASERLSKNPNDIEAIIGMGWAYYQNGQFNEAMAQYSKALKKNKDHMGVRLNMGLTYLQMGKLDLAAENFNIVLAADNKNVVALMNLAVVHKEKKNYDKAVELLQRAYKYNLGSPEILYQIGENYGAKGDANQAAFYYKEALKFNPGFDKAKAALEKVKGGK